MKFGMDIQDIHFLKTNHSPEVVCITFFKLEDYDKFIAILLQLDFTYACLEGTLLMCKEEFDTLVSKVIEL